MVRTVVYASRPLTLEEEKAGAQPPGKPDGFSDKLTKYIPGEVIAFFLPAYALVQQEGRTMQWLTLAIGTIGAVVYLIARTDRQSPPRWFFYVLGGLAFPGWAIGTTSVGCDLWGISPEVSTYTALVTAFLVPAIDEALTRVLGKP